MFIRDVIQDREPYSLRASASVLEAAEFMAERKIGAVCVLNDEDKLIGVFSERDLLSRVVVLRRDAAADESHQPGILRRRHRLGQQPQREAREILAALAVAQPVGDERTEIDLP